MSAFTAERRLVIAQVGGRGPRTAGAIHCQNQTAKLVNARGGDWLFARRRERHWYAVDVNERPQAVGFDSWHDGAEPALPEAFPTWAGFWSPPA